MTIQYLNRFDLPIDPDMDDHDVKRIPGEFIVYPSAVRVHFDVDANKNIFPQLLENPYATSSFFHEFQHFLSFVGTLHGNIELFMLMGHMDVLFEPGGVFPELDKCGKRFFDLPRPIIQYLCYDRPSWASESLIKSAGHIDFSMRMLNMFRGHYSTYFQIGPEDWPYENVVPPESIENYFPPKIGMRGPHSGRENEPVRLGTHLIHEGAARTIEYRVLFEFIHNKKINNKALNYLDEQAYYQMSRTILYGLFDQFAPEIEHRQRSLWHSLICDLSLMGPLSIYDMTRGDAEKEKWEDVLPGWRFWNAAKGSVELAKKGVNWDTANFTKEQYVNHADLLCDKLNWKSYDELIQVGISQMEFYFYLSGHVDSFIRSYYQDMLRTAWTLKSEYPHLFFNYASESGDFSELISRFGFPRILLTSDFIISGFNKESYGVNSDQIFQMLHAYCIVKQFLSIRPRDKFYCYQKYFNFSCKHSNGLCGTVPDKFMPKDCPFQLWLKGFDLENLFKT